MRRPLALLLVLLAGACARERARPPASPAPEPVSAPAPPPPAPSPAPVASTAPAPVGPTCEVSIEVFGRPYAGEATGTGTSDDADDKKAWAIACGAMQKAEGVGCDDEDRFTYVISTHDSISKGKTSRRVHLTVRPRLDKRTRTASSPAGWREACLDAVTRACSPSVPDQKCDPATVSCIATDDSAKCRPIRERPFRPDAERIVDPTLNPF